MEQHDQRLETALKVSEECKKLLALPMFIDTVNLVEQQIMDGLKQSKVGSEEALEWHYMYKALEMLVLQVKSGVEEPDILRATYVEQENDIL